jgi:hypothetical protein
MNEERTRKCLRKVENIRGHLGHKTSHGGDQKTFNINCHLVIFYNFSITDIHERFNPSHTIPTPNQNMDSQAS